MALSSAVLDLLDASIGRAHISGSARVVLTLEATVRNISGDTTETFYYATQSFRTRGIDTPSLTIFRPRFLGPNVRKSIWSSGQIGVGSLSTQGELVLLNGDGGLDDDFDLRTYSWGGRQVTVKIGGEDWGYTAAISGRGPFETLLLGTVRHVTYDEDTVKIALAEPWPELAEPIPQAKYAGTGGYPPEGASDQAGIEKPLVFGHTRQTPMILVDTTDNIYQVHDGPLEEITSPIQDTQGKGAGDGDVADVRGHTYSGGTFWVTDHANGLIAFKNAQSGPLHCECKGAKPSGSWLSKTGDIVDEVLQNYLGIASGDIDATSLSDYDTAELAVENGFVAETGKTPSALEFLEWILAPLGSWFYTRAGMFSLKYFEDPTGTETLTIEEADISEFSRLPVLPPVWSVSVQSSYHWVIPASDTDASNPGLNWEKFTREYRNTSAALTDSAVQADHLDAREVTLGTPDYGPTNNLRDDIANLYGTERDCYRLRLKAKIMRYEIGDLIKVNLPRFGITNRKMWCVGYTENWNGREFMLEVFG